MTERDIPEKHTTQAVQPTKKVPETKKLENKNIKEKNLRSISLEQLDYTYVPSYVPTEFTRTVRPFFDRAKEICQLWDRAIMAYRTMKFHEPIERFLPTVIKAFKETVYKYKQRRLQKGFIPYYYGTLAAMLVVEKRRMGAGQQLPWSWLEE
jgi:hypothetical protein